MDDFELLFEFVFFALGGAQLLRRLLRGSASEDDAVLSSAPEEARARQPEPAAESQPAQPLERAEAVVVRPGLAPEPDEPSVASGVGSDLAAAYAPEPSAKPRRPLVARAPRRASKRASAVALGPHAIRQAWVLRQALEAPRSRRR